MLPYHVLNSNTSNIRTNILLSKQDLKDVIKTLIKGCAVKKKIEDFNNRNAVLNLFITLLHHLLTYINKLFLQ